MIKELCWQSLEYRVHGWKTMILPYRRVEYVSLRVLQRFDNVDISEIKRSSSHITVWLYSCYRLYTSMIWFGWLRRRMTSLIRRVHGLKLEFWSIALTCFPQSSACTAGRLFFITLKTFQLREVYERELGINPTLDFLSRQLLQPFRDRTMLVFLGLAGAGLYISSRVSRHVLAQKELLSRWIVCGRIECMKVSHGLVMRPGC